MKKFKLFTLIMLAAYFAGAQDTNYKVVFDMTSKDTVNQQSLMRQLTTVRKLSPHAQLEVVIYGQGLDLVVRNKTTQETVLLDLLKDKGISFKVCEATMQRQKVDKTQLLPGVETVPDGIYEIFLKQQQGWGYIKVAH